MRLSTGHVDQNTELNIATKNPAEMKRRREDYHQMNKKFRLSSHRCTCS
jgi:hypothetical protein